MANKDQVIQMIQLKLRNQEVAYKSHIETTLELAWAILANTAEWWFLRAPVPIPISITSDDNTFEVNGEDIGRVLYVATEKNRRIWQYKSRAQWLIYCRGFDDSTTGAVGVFTDLGIKGNKQRQFQVHPIPNADETRYLHYQEAGTLANLNKLPLQCVKVLIHLVASMLVPPQKTGEDYWQALTYKEDAMFQYWLAEMIRHEAAVTDEELELRIDDLIQDRLDEVKAL